MHKIELPEDYAIVLSQVDKNGAKDFDNLAESLSYDRNRLSHILKALQHKRLIKISKTARSSWISLTSRGQRLKLTLRTF